MGRQRVTDVVELLAKLKELRIFPNAVPRGTGGMGELLANDRAHLVYIMPAIVDCISTKEGELRDAIKDILQEIGRMLIGELPELKSIASSNP